MIKLMCFAVILGFVILGLTSDNLLAQEVKQVSSKPGEMGLRQSSLPAGVYDITLRLQIDRKENTVSTLATLTVGSDEYQNMVWKVITPYNFDNANTPQDFTFHFDNFKTQNIQAVVELAQNKEPVPKLTVERITIAPDPKVSVGTVWPGKILYHRDEEAKGLVAVYNGTNATQDITLRCTLESDLNNVRQLKEENLRLAPLERREVSLTWNTGKEEYGFALVGTLVDSQGKEISQVKEYFSVADNLWKVGITQNGRACWVPNAPGANEGLPVSEVKKWEKQLSAELAKPFTPVYWNYANYNEFFAWAPDDFFDLAPDRDYWYTGTGNYTYSKRHLQMAVEWLHRKGMRAIAYLNPSSIGYKGDEVYRQHPEWVIYKENGQIDTSGVYYQKKLEAGKNVGGENPWSLQLSPYALSLRPNIATLEVIDAQIDQIVKSEKMFGWDGVRYDNFVFFADGYDFYGNKIDGNDPKKRDELEVRAWAHMRDSLWKKIGTSFVVGTNCDYQLRGIHSAVWQEACRKGQLLMEEMAGSSSIFSSAQNKWQDYMSYYQRTGEIVRSLGGHHVLMHLSSKYPVDHLYMNIFTYAGRSHPYSYGYNSDNLPFGNYAQFITRYSSLIWDIEKVKALPEPEKIIQIESSQPIWWKEYACIREAPNGKRQYIIHLINPPVQERIYTDPASKVPLPQTDITVTLKLEGREKITKAYLLSAEPFTHQEVVPVVRKEDMVSVRVPKLYFWNMVVLE